MRKKRFCVICLSFILGSVFLLFPVVSLQAATESYLGIDNDSQFIKVYDTQRNITDAFDAFFIHYENNPIISGSNIDSPNVVRFRGVTGTWNNFVSQLGSGGKEIFKATTTQKDLRSGWSSLTKVVSRGGYSNIDDPSVVITGDPYQEIWYMALTCTRVSGTNWISIITSADGSVWSSLANNAYEINISGATFDYIQSPSLIYNKALTRYELYFEGIKSGESLTQHLAYSSEAFPHNFTYQQSVGDMVNADVKLVNGKYIAAYRNVNESTPRSIRYSNSTDGKSFIYKGIILQEDGLKSYDNQGVEKPCFVVEGEQIIALAFSGNNSTSWDAYQIGIAYPQTAITFKSGSVSHVNREAINPYTQKISVGSYMCDRMIAQDYPGSPNTIDKTVASKAGYIHSIINKYFQDAHRISAWSSSDNPSFPAGNGIDGSAATMYSSNAQPTKNTVTTYNIDLGNAVGTGTYNKIDRIRIKPRSDSKGFPVSFSFESSNDAISWTQIPGQSYTNFPTPPTGGADVVFAFSKYVKAEYIRINVTELGTDGSNWVLQFTEFYADTHNSLDWGSNVTGTWINNQTDLLYNFTNLYNARVVYNAGDANYPYKMWIFGYADTYANDRIYAARAASINGPWQVYMGNGQWDTTMDKTKWVPVLCAGNQRFDNTHNGDPSVVLLNGTYYMAFSSVGIETRTDPDGQQRTYIINCIMGATSTDGINWTKSSQPILIWDREYTEGWDASKPVPPSYGGYHRPSLMYDDGKWKMWFDYYYPGTFLSTGYAENTVDFMSAANWSVIRKDNNPVIRNWVNPSIVKSGSTYYAFSDPEGFNNVLGPHRQIVMQTSTDGLNWTLSGYLRPENGYEGCHVPEAYIQNENGTNYLYLFYSRQPESYNPYDPTYKSVRYLKKSIP